MKKEFVDLKKIFSQLRKITSVEDRGTSEERGQAQISCPFCGDKEHHLGVNFNRNVYNCYKCPARGSATDLLKKLGVSFRMKDTAFSTDDSVAMLGSTLIPKINLPKDFRFNQEVFEKFLIYMSSRGLDYNFLKSKFEIWPITDSYHFYYGYVIVKLNDYAFYGRKFLKLDEKKPKHIIRDNNKENKSKLYYAYDSGSKNYLVVESIFNLMKAAQYGYSAIAILGKTKWSALSEFVKNNRQSIEAVTLAFDKDVRIVEIEQFYKSTSQDLKGLSTYYISPDDMPVGDIADMTSKEMLDSVFSKKKTVDNIFLDSLNLGAL